MGFEHFQVSKAGAPFRHAKGPASKAKRADVADPSCATGAFYSAPTLAASYDSMTPLTITWQPSLNCLLPTPDYADIFLYAPGLPNPRIYVWQKVPYAPGAYSVDLMPRWWNSTSSISLQLMVVPTGNLPFLNPIPAGPVFTATYTANTTGPVPAAADTSLASQDTGSTMVTPQLGGVSTHHISKGATAAAVLLPLLFVLLLGAAYLKVSRARGAARRSEWSEKLDKRMSTISADWKSITPGGAREAVRHSIAVSRQSFGFGATNATSDVDAPAPVMGEKPPRVSAEDLPRTSLGSGVGVGVGARRPKTRATTPERGSRAVSFAESAHPRPSMTNSVYSRTSRAFHTASAYGDFAESEAPPVPALPSPSRISAYGNTDAGHGQSVYVNGGAWSSGERVEGVDGGYGAQSVSPTGRVHTINYPVYDYDNGNNSTSDLSHYANSTHHDNSYDNSNMHYDNGAYGNSADANASYFSPTTPTPNAAFPSGSPDSAYNANTYAAFGTQDAMTSPKQTAGPLTLTPDDIRRRMTRGSVQQSGNGEWRQSVDEVFGALSMMRTGTDPSSSDAVDDDAAGEYLFAPMPETVFAYPGTPAVGSSFSSPAAPASSPFAMPMSAPTMSPDEMLRAYASTHTAPGSPAPSSPSPLAKALPLGKALSRKSSKPQFVSPLSNSTAGAEVVSTYNGTGMRVLYAQPEEGAPAVNEAGSRGSGMIRAGPGARLSR